MSWNRLLNVLSAVASVITIGLFVSDLAIGPIDESMSVQYNHQTETAIDGPQADTFAHRIELLRRAASNIGSAVIDVLVLLARLAVVAIVPWLPAYGVFKGVRACQVRSVRGQTFAMSVGELNVRLSFVWPVAASTIAYVAASIIAAAAIFPSFYTSRWIWNWIGGWAQ